ncbi:FDLD family class I lanthipeptide [Nonomuraea sp. NPDC050451]|uniref:FDLD family class I lanthipeptide n=1 Tax=Nonomuraea sp. NPDC050451 TaxID=3364364 RepID=UPI0037BC3C5B
MTAPTFDLVTTETIDHDDEFDLDIRIAVGADVALPEAGFSCSWYTCNATQCGCSIDGCSPFPTLTKGC